MKNHNNQAVVIKPGQIEQSRLFEDGLIKVYQTDAGELIVDGRELWEGLEVGTEFSHWVKRRLDECDAVENEDYSTNVKKDGRQLLNEYIIKLDIAKEMAMLERNEKGKQYRKYLIAVEKKYKELMQNPFAQLSPELQAIFLVDGKIQQVEHRVNKLENTMTIDYGQAKQLKDMGSRRVIEALGGYDSQAYKKISNKVFAQLWRDYKNHFNINTYSNTALVDYERGKDFISNWVPSEEMRYMINGANADPVMM